MSNQVVPRRVTTQPRDIQDDTTTPEFIPVDESVLLKQLNAYPLDSFTEEKRLGRGGFGDCWVARCRYFGPCAVKLFNVSATPKMKVAENLLGHLFNNHPNVVRYFGYIYQTDRTIPQGLVMELLEQDLCKYIRGPAKDMEDVTRKLAATLGVLVGVSRAICFLHDIKHSLHRDLKPENILLNFNGVAKVADFGLAKQLVSIGGSNIHTINVGTPGYMAPEIVHPTYSYPVDVFSLGMVGFFIITENHAMKVLKIAARSEWINRMRNGDRPDFRTFDVFAHSGQPSGSKKRKVSGNSQASEEAYNKLVDLIKRCWMTDSQTRPVIVEVVRELEEILALTN